MKTRFPLAILLALTYLAAGCTNSYTVSLIDATGQPLSDTPVILTTSHSTDFFPVGGFVTFSDMSDTTNADGQVSFQIDTDRRIYEIAIGEQWLYRNLEECWDFHPMRTHDEIATDHRASQLTPLPDRPWIKLEVTPTP